MESILLMGLGFKNRHEGLASGLFFFFFSPFCFFFFFLIKKRRKQLRAALRVSRGLEEEQGSEESTEHPVSLAGTLQSGEDDVGLDSQLSSPLGWMGKLSRGSRTGLHTLSLPRPRVGVGMGPWGRHVPASPRASQAALGSSQPPANHSGRGDARSPTLGPLPSPASPRTGPTGKRLGRVPWQGWEENHTGNADGERPDPATAQGPAPPG